MAVVSDELCDSDVQPPHQAGVQSDPGGVWTHQEPENKAEALSVPHLCPGSQRQGLCLGSLVIIAMVIPASQLCSFYRTWSPRIWTHPGRHKQKDMGIS